MASIKQKSVKLVLPSLYPAQLEAIFSPKRFSLIESGTKTGKTIGCAIWLVHNAWNNPQTNWWWTAPVYKQVKIGFNRCVSLLPTELIEVNASDNIIKLPNGSVIEGRSGEKPDNLYGDAVNGFVLDEASRYREDSWHALRTTITQTKGIGRIPGNPKGKKNWFYRMCLDAKDPLKNEELAYFHLRTIDNPFIDPKEVENARRLLPRHIFEELYLGIAQDDVSGVFSNFRSCIASTLSPPKPRENYWAGVDIAKYENFTVVSVLNNLSQLVYFERFNRMDWNIQKSKIEAILKRYNNAKTLIDSTGVGDPIFDDLRTRGLDIQGYKFTNETKRVLIEGLMVAFENGSIKIDNIPELLNELDLFEYQITPSGNVTYAAQEGYDDDCVISLALARHALGTIRNITVSDIRATEIEPSITSQITGY